MRRLDAVLVIAIVAVLTCMQCSEDGPGEVITKCDCPSGPGIVDVGSVATYSTDGATSSKGCVLEYQFRWGDGTVSDWSFDTDRQHSWSATGNYEVQARARCSEHTDKVSPWSDAKEVQVGNGAPVPTRPVGDTPACIGERCVYSTDHGRYFADKTLEIQFDWAADGLSDWETALTREHTWKTDGTYRVRARTRFAGYEMYTSAWSQGLDVIVGEETIPTPELPGVQPPVCPEETKTFCARDTVSSCGHALQYRFDWGDGTISEWSSSNCASKAWASLGTHAVTAQARCAEHNDKVSHWSDPVAVTVDETVPTPDSPSGPDQVCAGEEEEYSTDEVSSSCVPDVEYEFDWGDGSHSDWSPSPSDRHAWSAGGAYLIRIRARSTRNPSVVSGWSSPTVVTVIKESISVPVAPAASDGRSIICLDEQKTFCIDAVTSTCGLDHPIEYQFSWGDGTLSQWASSPCCTHSWSLIDTYEVKARARCALHTDIVSAWSPPRTIIVQEEEVTKPTPPSGHSCPCPDQLVTFSTGDAVSSCGHTVEYAFDWGDGSGLDFQPTPTRSHSWSVEQDYEVKAIARCATHKIESEWSDIVTVRVGADCEVVSRPDAVSGPSGGCPGETMTFRTDGSVSSCGHDVEYQFDWGDGGTSGWTASGIADHAFTGTGTYQVKSRARCVDHTSKVSSWSGQALDVGVSETISTPDMPSGPPSLCAGEAGTYTSRLVQSDCGHAVEYYFDWGYGSLDGPYPDPTASHAWSQGGTYQVSVRAKCRDHDVWSAFSPSLMVRVFDAKYLEIGCACGGGVIADGNYPGNHMPECISTVVACGNPSWSDCDAGAGGCQAVFEPRHDPAVVELDDPDPAVNGVYIGASTEEIEVTLTADFRRILSSGRKIIVTVGTCSWEPVGLSGCHNYEHSFRRADGCFSGTAVPVKLEVPDVHRDAAISALRLDFVGWCN
jgi:hypothetical protein